MDSKDLELYYEENRKFLIDLNKGIQELIPLIKQQTEQYVAPLEKIQVEGQVKVNTEKQIEVSNIEDVVKQLEKLSSNLGSAIKENSYKPLKEITVKNIEDARGGTVKVTNLNELKSYLDNVAKIIIKNKPIINVEKQDITFPKLPRDAIPVRLSDGKSFYKALETVSQGVATIAGETDPLVGYQPSDIDDSGSTKYYGFVKKDGRWYIMRQSSSGAFRYAKGAPLAAGGGVYSDAWTDRTHLTYSYFYEVF